MAAPEPGDEFNVPSARGTAVARGLTVLLGVWLFISAFAWSHNTAQLVNTVICGVLVVALALVAMSAPNARWLITLLAMWLLIGTAAFGPSNIGTRWNNALVAMALFFLSFVPGVAHGEWRRPHIPRPA